jgi:conjugal transfer mating pair stabilization protein TraN
MRSSVKKRVVNSRLKAYQQFIDNFGDVVLKPGWKSYRGSWVLGTGVAVSSSDPSTYAISGVKLSLPNLTASVGVTGGTGLTYWVSDANSWVASVSYNTTATSYPCNAGLVTNQSNPPSGSCCSGVQTIPGSAAFSYTAQWNPAYSYSYTATWNGAYSYSYGAPYQAGYSYSYGAYTSPAYSYTYNASNSFTARTRCCGTYNIAKDFYQRTNGIGLCGQCSGPCDETYSFSACCPSGTEKQGSTCYYPGSNTWSCPSGGSLSGTTCTVSVAASTTCPSGGSLSGSNCIVSVAGGYYCPSGSLSGTTCTVQVAGGYSCPSGGSLSGSSCIVSVAGSYSCPSGGSLSGTTCNVAAGANQYSCYTQTTTSTVYNYYLKVIKSIGGVVSSVGTDVALPSQPLAVKVVISGTSVQSTAYSTVGMSTSIGTRSDTITSPSPTGVVGIIKSPSPYSQGSTVSNFSATI